MDAASSAAVGWSGSLLSRPKPFEKPPGLRDYLPAQAVKLKNLESRLLDCMRRWGYRPIITPTLEYYDTVGAASATSEAKLFKLLGQNGTTIVLRPEMTAPIARVAATLLRNEPLPLRLAYHANVFRAFGGEAGKDPEFWQTGVELIGDATPDADAEVIALAAACLETAGVRSFALAIGHAGFLHAMLADVLRDRPQAQEELKSCLSRRDFAGFRERLDGYGLPSDVRGELESMLRMRGGRDICDAVSGLSGHPEARQALEQLGELWEALQAFGAADRVRIDLTLTGDFTYYTGMTFEGYADGVGFPIASGGRYDRLLAQFGRPAPATGFALKTNRILELVDDGGTPEPERVLVVYAPHRRQEALQKAAELRRSGTCAVETMRTDVAAAAGVGPESSAAARILWLD